ncbi:hypothetical protein [Halostagnicola sp. A-GB9-2]|uniref:hypothetical protein n=1 Tax=Halostagnicola sp. A-GB9-2 TaxID=3048066 RepID=UPI0024C09FBA|nr:hypothetical protein [Halostagnicola sp. A-GB9-2]MDJ1433604.1 hypothetical protein [Halostagnicola sp. A-GB9-2]
MRVQNTGPAIGDSVEAQFLGRPTTGEVADIRFEPSISTRDTEYVLKTDSGKIIVPEGDLIE